MNNYLYIFFLFTRRHFQNTQNRLSRISLPGHPNMNTAEVKHINPSFYTQVTITDAEDIMTYNPSQDENTDLSSTSLDQSTAIRRSRPNSTCEMYSRFRDQSSSPTRQFRDDHQTFSTIRRTHSPFRRPSVTETVPDKGPTLSMARRPPLPRKYQPVERPPIPPRSDSVDRINMFTLQGDTACAWQAMQVGEEDRQVTPVNTAPRCLQISNLPDFNQGQKDMGKCRVSGTAYGQ